MKFIVFFLIYLTPVLALAQTNECLEGDCQNGQGKLKCACGYVFEGMFKNGQKVFGTMIKKELTYKGEFKDDMVHGKGKITYKDGSWYEGEFEFTQLHGEGEYHHTSGWIYKGLLAYNKYEGFGTLYQNEQGKLRIKQGEFLEDELNGFGFYKNIVGDVYIGEFKKSKFHGVGIWLNKTENSYDFGTFKKDEFNNEIPVDVERDGAFSSSYTGKSGEYQVSVNADRSIIEIKKKILEKEVLIRFNKKDKEVYIGTPDNNKGILLYQDATYKLVNN